MVLESIGFQSCEALKEFPFVDISVRFETIPRMPDLASFFFPITVHQSILDFQARLVPPTIGFPCSSIKSRLKLSADAVAMVA